jgi:hypothetical protein
MKKIIAIGLLMIVFLQFACNPRQKDIKTEPETFDMSTLPSGEVINIDYDINTSPYTYYLTIQSGSVVKKCVVPKFVYESTKLGTIIGQSSVQTELEQPIN